MSDFFTLDDQLFTIERPAPGIAVVFNSDNEELLRITPFDEWFPTTVANMRLLTKCCLEAYAGGLAAGRKQAIAEMQQFLAGHDE